LLALKQTRPEVCSKQNHLVDPAEVDGLLGFYVENQAVYRWAYRAGEADPIVWGRYLHEDAWTAEAERLGGFLLQVCLFEALFSAPYSASAACLAPDALPAVLGPLRPVLGPWRWPGAPTVFHASDGAIAMTCRNDVAGQVGLDVLLAARQLEPLAYLLNVIDANDGHWEHARLGELVL
jgi:hypothetical protein